MEILHGTILQHLLINWPLPSGERQRFAVELKVWRRDRDPDPLDQGLEQLSAYPERPVSQKVL